MVFEYKFKSNKINDIIDVIGGFRNVTNVCISEKLFWAIVPRKSYINADEGLIIYINNVKVYGVDYLDGLEAYVTTADYVNSRSYIFNADASTYTSYQSCTNLSDLISSLSFEYSCTNDNHGHNI